MHLWNLPHVASLAILLVPNAALLNICFTEAHCKIQMPSLLVDQTFSDMRTRNGWIRVLIPSRQGPPPHFKARYVPIKTGPAG